MFTQCPACQTVFKLSAETLRAAAGEVRCGRCAEQFNALRSLAEDPKAFAPVQGLHALTAGSAVPLSAAPLVDPQPEVLLANSEPEVMLADAQPEVLVANDDSPAHPATLADDPSLEFTLPPGELDRIFVEARPHHFTPRQGPLALQGLEDLDHPDVQPAEAPEPQDAQTDTPESAGPVPATALDETALPPELPAGTLQTREGLTPDQWIEQALPTRSAPDLAPPSRTRRNLWIAGGAALFVLLAAQLIHFYRDVLAQAPVIGNPLRALYALAGHPIEPPMNLAAFEIRPWGVTGDTSADGVLRVRASLINNAAEPQPWPLLRLKLEDRFGARVGARDFLPAEYLHKIPPPTLAPGERADLLVEVVDPGKRAEGFELDVCEGRPGARVLCAHDPQADKGTR